MASSTQPELLDWATLMANAREASGGDPDLLREFTAEAERQYYASERQAQARAAVQRQTQSQNQVPTLSNTRVPGFGNPFAYRPPPTPRLVTGRPPRSLADLLGGVEDDNGEVQGSGSGTGKGKAKAKATSRTNSGGGNHEQQEDKDMEMREGDEDDTEDEEDPDDYTGEIDYRYAPYVELQSDYVPAENLTAAHRREFMVAVANGNVVHPPIREEIDEFRRETGLPPLNPDMHIRLRDGVTLNDVLDSQIRTEEQEQRLRDRKARALAQGTVNEVSETALANQGGDSESNEIAARNQAFLAEMQARAMQVTARTDGSRSARASSMPVRTGGSRSPAAPPAAEDPPRRRPWSQIFRNTTRPSGLAEAFSRRGISKSWRPSDHRET